MKRSLVVSIVGRPNVGKSSLFNRLMGKQHQALAVDMPGVTRDRHYGIAKISYGKRNEEIVLIDTGGFYPEKVEIDQLPGTSKRALGQMNADKFFNLMSSHVKTAVEESDLVIFVGDGREGLLPYDEQIAHYLRSSGKPFWMVVNKIDTNLQNGDEAPFYVVGVDEDQFFPISSAHGVGIELLKEKLVEFCEECDRLESASLLQKGITPREDVVSRVAIVGAPNAGKSTLVNQLVGAKRSLVSDIPGTTVDPIGAFFDLYFGPDVSRLTTKSEKLSNSSFLTQYSDFRKNNPDLFDQMLTSFENEELDIPTILPAVNENSEEQLEGLFDDEAETFAEDTLESDQPEKEKGSFWRTIHVVDTAGIRRRSQIHGEVEELSVYRSLRAIGECDIVLYMVDCTRGISHHDRRLIDISIEKGKSVIICMNKIDLAKKAFKTDKDRKVWLDAIRKDLPWLNYCDILPISAKNGQAMQKLKEVIKSTTLVRHDRVPTSKLNKAIFSLIERKPAFVGKGKSKRLKVKYAAMVKSSPPTFLLFSNHSDNVPVAYEKYLKNGLRGQFNLSNSPIHLVFRSGRELESRMRKI